MGIPSSPGRAAPHAAGRSINFYLTAGLLAPVTIMLALWGAVAGLVLAGYLDKLHWVSTQTPTHRAVIGAAVIAGAGLIVVIVAVARVDWFARRMSAEISGLTATAGSLANEHLPRIVSALRSGEQAGDDDASLDWPAMKTAEVTAVAAAIAGLHRAAVSSAVAEASLRRGYRQILVSLGRRNQSLLHRQLRIIDGLEQQASDPAALADLFTLDHLTTRMRRHAESLTILSGAASGRSWSGPVPVIDVMRAAAAEVEDYTRVTVITDSDEAIGATAVTDMIHLLAELIENATLFSPSSTRVEVRAERVANGFAIEVEDRGLGIPPDQLIQINAQLSSPPDFDLADADRLGLFVAGRLAARHGVHVALAPSAYRGIKAVVVLPDSIMAAPARPGAEARPSADPVTGRSVRLNLRAPEVLSLASTGLPESLPAFDEPQGELALTLAAQTPAEPRADARAEAPAAPAAPTTTLHGLPRRIRPSAATADTAPESLETAHGEWDDQRLAADADADADADGLAPRPARPESPAPEHARTLAASLQNSWYRSRLADEEPGDGSGDGGDGDGDGSDGTHGTDGTDSTRDNAADSGGA
jgi:signal transduction histidine kinase